MAYFSSGTEGLDYMARYCATCRNCGDDKYEFGCAVWDLHTLYQSERDYSELDGGPVGRMLDSLIPREGGGLANGQCLMYRRRVDPEQEVLGQMTLLEQMDHLHGKERSDV